jgi:hypothetical protein
MTQMGDYFRFFNFPVVTLMRRDMVTILRVFMSAGSLKAPPES